MDDLSQQINQILSDPKSMQQIQSMMSALGVGAQPESREQPVSAPPAEANSGGVDAAALSGILSALGSGGGNTKPEQPQPVQNPLAAISSITPEMLQAVGKIAPLLSSVNREDDSTRLLHALRPLLSHSRQKKLDEAVKILQMMRLLPLLKDSGLFSGLLSGLL